ncbi:RHS repeat-associated core domain-containing protein [Streptomyces albiaxialis]|uniref:RHS repeat-associated core domain-containing protein n=1 Tax=Streptomyces albiaxialis TaxID=329523 RepID=A0ABN2WFT4_9ACTN
MTQKDATEGGTVERIPPNAEPGDVIFGKPSDVDDLVVKLRAYAGAFKDGKAKLDVLMFKPWTGAASEAFDKATEKLPKELDSAHTYFGAAANALDAYADKLRSVQKRVKPIIEDADEARATSKRYWKKVEAYNAAVERGDAPLPERPPDQDPGVAAMEACHRRLDKLEGELDGVVTAAKRKLDKAAEKAPKRPPGLSKWDAKMKEAKDFGLGMGDAGSDMLKEFEFFVEDGTDGARMRLAGMVDGAAYAVENPKEFAKAVSNWDEWQRNPNRAAGQLTPGLLLALATGGTGALRQGGTAAKNAAQRLASREKALRRDGSARERADGEPGRNDKSEGEKKKAGEPIDVATGEMVMSATDVSLPGALPLVLERHHVSGHPCGGWFGPTWAATLDQRLELDEAGVVYVAPDGMVLRYPVPDPDAPVLPATGPRWPLAWDGKPDGTMTLTVPEQNRALHFAPLPLGGRELALRAITDRTGEGDRLDFTYDDQGAPAEITHSGGYRVAVDTDPSLSRVTALRLLDGDLDVTLVSFAYDGAGNLAEVINSTGLPLRYRYDAEHRVTSWTDRNGTSFAYVYDHRGRVLRTLGPDGMMSGRFHYEPAARTTRYTDSLGHTTTYVYNEAYKVVRETDPLGHTTHTEWDDTNRHPLSVTDPMGRTTRRTYDGEGNCTSVTRPDGTAVEATYDDWGLPLEIREPGGGVWRHTYDARGNRLSTTDPTGATTRYAYDTAGHLCGITDASGRTTRVTANSTGLPVEVTDPSGALTRVTRGPHGRITSLTDPMGHTTRQGWTIEGKPAWRAHPDGTRETWEWDGEGNLLSHRDEAGNVTSYTHTHFDLPATRTDPDGAHYAFAYDTELRLRAVTNPQGREWRYEYDEAGRLIAETDFNGASRTYALNAAGELVARTNACGETLRYELDALGRVLRQRDESSGEETTYAYDARGDLRHAANATTELTWERDELGRVLAETADGRTTTYAYDAAGHRTRRTTPSGLVSTWTYDARGLPATLTTADTTLTFAYDEAGRETRRAVGGVTLSQSWDETDRLTTQQVTGPGPGPDLLQHRTYTYRPDGYVTEIRELTTGTRHFALDARGRVTGVQAHGWTEKYAYDTAGNQTEAEAPAHPAPGGREHEGTLIRRAGRTTYAYDAAGRTVRKTRKLLNGRTRTWTYTWNAEDRLTRATTPDGEEWTYTYDPLGRRTTKTGPSGRPLIFTWDGTRLAEQTERDGATTTWDYAPGTHRPLCQTESELGTTRFHAVVTDAVGTPTELVTPAGEVPWQHRTTLWGTPLPSPPERTTCPLRYPGQYADPETGLNYNYFRYYDPETARYLTPDPLGLGPAPNPHSYVPNPDAWSDPLGLAKCGQQVRDEFNTLRKGTSKRTGLVDSLEELQEQFDSWTEGAEKLPARGPKVPDVYKLEDGTIIQWRTASTSGGETIDLIFPDSNKARKVHIDSNQSSEGSP